MNYSLSFNFLTTVLVVFPLQVFVLVLVEEDTTFFRERLAVEFEIYEAVNARLDKLLGPRSAD